MNCPYCGKEMEKGVIQSPHEINWKKKKAFIGRAMFYLSFRIGAALRSLHIFAVTVRRSLSITAKIRRLEHERTY